MIDSRYFGPLAAALLLSLAGLSPSTALAQEEPVAEASATPLPNETSVGPWIALGENTWANNGSVTGLRLEAGWPLKQIGDGQLSIMLPVVYAPSGGSAARVHEINIVPGVRFEWPVLDRWGKLLIWGDIGYGVHIATSEVVDTSVWGALRVAAGATFVFPFGLLLTLQPVGVMATLIGENDGEAKYEFSFVAGYRF